MDSSLSQNALSRVLIVGSSSMIAQGVMSSAPEVSWRTASARTPLTPEDLEGIETVINFALTQEYRVNEYDEANDIDLALARAIADRPIRYILLSSRKVYGLEGQFGVAEEGLIEPQGNYGINKYRTEGLLSDFLGDRLTTLRVSNVLGDERIPGRKSFMSMMLGGLVERDTITMDVHPSVRRDFISAPACGKALLQVMAEPIPGIFNFGSGEPVAMGTIAEALMKGFGSGKIDVINDRVFDEFVLNVTKWNNRFGQIETATELLEYCEGLGRKYARI
ncbi:MAG: NAD(P)-dependent oxidoreductase [Armatimonadetes bacterium]|nr:NAD(P)-dependent oxidoreductase [Armatimonadota bacterium]